MANIKVLNNKFIIEGHTSKEECDTLTQVANVLDKSKEFKTIEYKNGYAEFERVVNSEELKFISSQFYNNDGTQLLGTINLTDAYVFYLKSDGIYRNDTLELAISNFVGLTKTINGTTPDSGYAVPTPSGNAVMLGEPLDTVWYAIQGSSNIQIPITKNGKTTLATKGTKNVEDIDINVDISPTIQSLSITPSETSQTFNASNVDGYKPVNVSAIQTETPTVNLSLASGNQTVNASSGKYIKSLTITKPSTLIASNIKSGVNIAGVNGSYEFKTQNKTFTPTQTGGSVSADSGYDGLGVVTVNPVPLGNKTDVPLNFYNQTAGTIVDTQNIYSDENKFMTWASVSRPSTLIAENIKKDINIAGITGTLESGGANLNIAYGDTAPSDTSKLWIKGSEAEVEISSKSVITSTNAQQLSPDIPLGSNHRVAAIDNDIYIFGGSSSNNGGDSESSFSEIRKFNCETKTVETLKVSLPVDATDISTAVVGKKIYLFGGRHIDENYDDGSSNSYDLNTIQVFNTAYGQNTLTTLSATLPVATSDIKTAVVGNNIYLFRGETIDVFNTTNNSISTLSTTLSVSHPGVAVVGKKIYLFGGRGSSSLNTINVFDTTNNTISTLSTTLPNAANDIGTAVVGTKIYLFGGYNNGSLNTINVFDTTNNTISTLSTTLPNAANDIGTAVVGTKIYLFGAATPRTRLGSWGSQSDYNEAVTIFDLTNNTCYVLALLLNGGDRLGNTVAVGNKIYTFGGGSSFEYSGSNSAANCTTSIQVFDTLTNGVTTLSTTLPTATFNISAAAVGTKIYLFGGKTKDSPYYLNTIHVFDTTNNTISTLSTTLPTALSSMGTAVVGTKIYLFGGNAAEVTHGWQVFVTSIKVFDTTNNTISTLSTTLPTALSSMGTAVVGSNIYIFGGYTQQSVADNPVFSTAIYVFNTANNTITTLSSTTKTSVVASINTKIYMFGSKIQILDTVSNSLITLNNSNPLWYNDNMQAAIAINSTIYIFGGHLLNSSSSNTSNNIGAFDCQLNTFNVLNRYTQQSGIIGINPISMNDKIYIFGGSSGGKRLDTINVFDTTNNTVATLSTKLPTATDNIATAAVGTKIYLFGGSRGSGRLNTIQVFDTTNNTISTLSTTLPNAANDIGTAVVGTKIYLFGGYNNGSLNTINVFDTTNNTISTLSTTLPNALYNISTAAVGTKIYLFGGEGHSSPLNKAIQVFDTTNNTFTNNSIWSILPAVPSGQCSAVGTQIYLVGCSYYDNQTTSYVIQMFDTITNRSFILDVVDKYGQGSTSTTVGNNIYIFFGRDTEANFTNSIRILTAQNNLASNNILITEGQQENIFNLLSSPTQVEISVKNVYRGDSSNVAQLNDAYLHNGTNWINVNTGETS